MQTPDNIQAALEFEGMTSELGLVIMDRFLNKAMTTCNDGLCFEFGTYKGRTSALIASYLQKNDWLHALEQSDYLELESLLKISPNVVWHKTTSENFCEDELSEIVGNRKISYTHHDASHFFSNVQIELSHIVDKMADYGVIVLDDFSDWFSQVRAAYYHLRYTQQFPFELLLVGFNKAILVHESKFDYYEDYVLNELLDELESNEAFCMLCRSDVNVNSRNFLLSLRDGAEGNKLYGTSWWGTRFYEPSHTILDKEHNATIAETI